MNLRRTVAGAMATTAAVAWGLSTMATGQHSSGPSASAFFYQTVAPTAAIVRAGATSDGTNIRTYDTDLVYANRGPESRSYGDAVFSRLANGRWTMTGRKLADSTTPAAGLVYFEGACPLVNDAEVQVLPASSATGCNAQRNPVMGKTSQVFEVDGSSYLFTMSGGEIYLTRLSSPSQPTSALTSICMKQPTVTTLQDLLPGDSGRVITSADAQGLLLSDAAIARRTDGTWVLFVKGISSTAGCTRGTTCELCARSIYRTTSTDLVHWSAIEKVVSQASVPEAVSYPDGSVWLYYQNFAPTCTANNVRVADRAPITGVYELDGGSMSYALDVTFSNEDFETNTSLHYPTNGNPIALPDETALEALNACMAGTPR